MSITAGSGVEVVAIDTPALGDRSYLAHDGSVALVVDPQRDIDRPQAAAHGGPARAAMADRTGALAGLGGAQRGELISLRVMRVLEHGLAQPGEQGEELVVAGAGRFDLGERLLGLVLLGQPVIDQPVPAVEQPPCDRPCPSRWPCRAG